MGDLEKASSLDDDDLQRPLLIQRHQTPSRPAELSTLRSEWTPHAPPGFASLMAQSVLVTGRIGRLQVSER